MTGFIWEMRDENEPGLVSGQAYRIAQALGISSAIAKILVNRGIKKAADAKEFLAGCPGSSGDPFALPDIDRAVERIRSALSRKEKILVYGDYDADGVTGTAIFTWCLRRLGGLVEYYIPFREEGYGLNDQAILEAKRRGIGLIITVDCGISAAAEVILANSLGIDVIITDHHQCPPNIPLAVASVNPHRPDSTYPFEEMAGVGVAYKVVQALLGDAAETALDLVALGTVADSVPLVGENRNWVRRGLQHFGEGWPGLSSLLKVVGLGNRQVTSDSIAYAIAPRINAAGRVTSAMTAVELLLEQEEGEAASKAKHLESENTKRQEIEASVYRDAVEQAQRQIEEGFSALVLVGEGWHPGVIGISAAKMAEHFNRPVFMISADNGWCKGSARGVPGFDVFKCLETCSHLLVRYGGHTGAGGFEIQRDNLEAFRIEVNRIADREVDPSVVLPKLTVDCEIELNEITESLPSELAKLEPYGSGNPQPVFASRGVEILYARTVGRDNAHLKMRVRQNGACISAVGFKMGDAMNTFDGLWDIAYCIQENNWNGKHEVELVVKDMKRHLPLERPYALSSQVVLSSAMAASKGGVEDEPIIQWVVGLKREDTSGTSLPGRVMPNFRKVPSRGRQRAREIAALSLARELNIIYANTARQAIDATVLVQKALEGSRPVLFHDPRVFSRMGYRLVERLSDNGGITITCTNPRDLLAWFERGHSGMAQTGTTTPYSNTQHVRRNYENISWMAGEIVQPHNPPDLGLCSLVLLYPPFSYDHMLSIIGDLGWAQSNGIQFYLAFGEKEISETEMLLRAVSTNRERLTVAYKALRDRADGDLGISKPLMIRHLSQVYGANGQLSAYIDLEIFKELGLIEESDDGRLFLRKPSCGKVDLKSSRIYEAVQNICGDYLTFVNHLSNLSKHEGEKPNGSYV